MNSMKTAKRRSGVGMRAVAVVNHENEELRPFYEDNSKNMVM